MQRVPRLSDLPPQRAGIQSVEVGYSALAALGMVSLVSLVSLVSFDVAWNGAVAAQQLSSDLGSRGA